MRSISCRLVWKVSCVSLSLNPQEKDRCKVDFPATSKDKRKERKKLVPSRMTLMQLLITRLWLRHRTLHGKTWLYVEEKCLLILRRLWANLLKRSSGLGANNRQIYTLEDYVELYRWISMLRKACSLTDVFEQSLKERTLGLRREW